MRLKHAAERQRTAVIVAVPRRSVGAFAASAIELLARAPLFDDAGPPLLAAIQTAVEVRRHRRSNDVASLPTERPTERHAERHTKLILRADRGQPWEPL